ncbi:hypothetical protein SPOG_05309 [Schizosaccharomyces cryophilus OY26]|uniref:Uncharacterized protein n=1 Tax=Schizosaccharomyces cryophilus (strain OY26 / ATCC MYA-4695 / CBS 11777 / NBRC 106824 / NRRL Y48691) TaxID=653667 RepID=S9VYF1_SCHCR|nr:uncharacterized protein SPOG_05309 [Schizosaccharomyces cryophilus OY26]EPY52703.1 hypothetical protein SPOG_05309 [Schizosaccharomyces cryophilus OY26]
MMLLSDDTGGPCVSNTGFYSKGNEPRCWRLSAILNITSASMNDSTYPLLANSFSIYRAHCISIPNMMVQFLHESSSPKNIGCCKSFSSPSMSCQSNLSIHLQLTIKHQVFETNQSIRNNFLRWMQGSKVFR